MHERELVSVVIPTRRRPQWIVCAVESVLKQSYTFLQVIVVVDGSDPETMNALQYCKDARLEVIALEENTGGSEARNIGVRAAQGEWIAFLDDDDWWMAEKLERQMQLAANSRVRYPIVSSRLLARSRDIERVLPRRLLKPGEAVGNYLFCRRGFTYGDGLLQTSTLLVRRNLLLQAPFQKDLKRHQDWDWLLKVSQRPDVEILMLPEPLTVMRVERTDGSVSRMGDWKTSQVWAKQNRSLMSARAYSFFISTECVSRARRSGVRMSALLPLFWECFWSGQPGLRQMALFFFFCFVPEDIRRQLRDRLLRTKTAMECEAYS